MVLRFLLVFLLLAGTAFSQTTFTGTLDGYYSGNFNKPPSRTNVLRAFDINHNEFSLNYAELAIEQKAAPVGFRVDLGFGDAARIVNAAEPACAGATTTSSSCTFYQHLQQAYVTGTHGKLTVDFGKFVTPAGAEVIETKDNWNYSRGLLFTWAIPFYHFGLRATAAATEKVSLGAFVSNGWNDVKDNNSGKTVGLMATVKPGKLTWTTNYIFGAETPQAVGASGGPVRHLIDTTATIDVSNDVSLMANYDYGMDRTGPRRDRVRWQGIAAYAKLKAGSKVTLVPRYEWFGDTNGFTTGSAQNLQEFTFTSQFALHNDVALYGEYRHDWTNLPAGSGPFEGRDIFDRSKPEDHQDTLTIGVVYTYKRER